MYQSCVQFYSLTRQRPNLPGVLTKNEIHTTFKVFLDKHKQIYFVFKPGPKNGVNSIKLVCLRLLKCAFPNTGVTSQDSNCLMKRHFFPSFLLSGQVKRDNMLHRDIPLRMQYCEFCCSLRGKHPTIQSSTGKEVIECTHFNSNMSFNGIF